jgi:DNA repair ATPase RecN
MEGATMRILVLVGLFACAKEPRPVAPELEVDRPSTSSGPEQTSQYKRADTISDDDVPNAVAKYRRVVRNLEANRIDPSHEQVVDALEELADAMDAVPRAPDVLERDADRVRDFADMVKESDPGDKNHARWVREAMLVSAEGLEELDVMRIEGMSDAIRQLRVSAMRLDPTMPLLQQRADMMDGFKAASDALVLATYEPNYGAGTY